MVVNWHITNCAISPAFITFYFAYFFEARFLCIVLTVQELSIIDQVGLNLQQSTCLYLPHLLIFNLSVCAVPVHLSIEARCEDSDVFCCSLPYCLEIQSLIETETILARLAGQRAPRIYLYLLPNAGVPSHHGFFT